MAEAKLFEAALGIEAPRCVSMRPLRPGPAR